MHDISEYMTSIFGISLFSMILLIVLIILMIALINIMRKNDKEENIIKIEPEPHMIVPKSGIIVNKKVYIDIDYIIKINFVHHSINENNDTREIIFTYENGETECLKENEIDKKFSLNRKNDNDEFYNLFKSLLNIKCERNRYNDDFRYRTNCTLYNNISDTNSYMIEFVG